MPDVPDRVAGLREALAAADLILSLLHYRGIVDSEWNRADVKGALDKIRRFDHFYMHGQEL